MSAGDAYPADLRTVRAGAREGTETLAALEAEIRGLGGLLGATAAPAPPGADGSLGQAAAHGPRAAGAPAEYALVVEAIREGALLHYGTGRVARTDDPDLALLAGDRLYALGLARLAELGDLAAVTELADVISLHAQAAAEERPLRAEGAWRTGAHAVGAGASPEHEAEKAACRAGGAAA